LSKTAGGLGEDCHSEIVVTSVLEKHYTAQKVPKSHKIYVMASSKEEEEEGLEKTHHQ
jgi:hypothetical protein